MDWITSSNKVNLFMPDGLVDPVYWMSLFANKGMSVLRINFIGMHF